MHGTPQQSRHWGALGGAAVGALLLVGAAPQIKTGVAQYQQQLGDRFTGWDLNGDGFLDKEELAKAFRGKDARPYDDADKRTQVYGLTLASLPWPAMAVQLAVADRLQRAAPPKTAKDYAQLPDYQFLIMVDTNADQKVSQKEFKAWAKGYARSLAARDKALTSLTQAQARLAKAKSAKTRQSAQTAVTRANANFNKALTQINAVPAAIRKAINVGLR